MINPVENSDKKIWTIIEILLWTTSYFKSYGIDTPRIDAEILLSSVLKLRRIDLYLYYDKPLLAEEIKIFKEAIIRRKNREPVAYITEIKEFWSMEFLITKDVLIPRSDTEIIVETAIKAIRNQNDKEMMILELGVGSGAIISALAFSEPSHVYFGIDNSQKALNIAKQNGLKHNLQIDFFLSNWFLGLKEKKIKFDIIISNPPYIPTKDIKNLQPEIWKYEPLSALDGGIKGLDSISLIISQAYFYLNNNGLLLLEIGFDQREKVLQIIDSKKKYKNIICLKDYGGNDRVLIMKKS